MEHTTGQRVRGCLEGLATGDAIGKQTECLTRAGIRKWYLDGIRGFEGTPGDVIPRYVGNRKREWRIGETSDDTEQVMLVVDALKGTKPLTHVSFGKQLLRMTKSLHPGAKSWWRFHQANDPGFVAPDGDGCGAAMRVAPIGIIHHPDNLSALVEMAYQSAIPTHGGQFAICGAAAVAAAVSAAVEGMPAEDVLSLAVKAAREGEHYRTSEGPTLADRLLQAERLLSQHSDLTVAIADELSPGVSQNVVPLAIALACRLSSAQDAILLAANTGGDSDTVASIAGAILGALRPETINRKWYAVVEQVNQHNLVAQAEDLMKLRNEGMPNKAARGDA